MFVDETNYSRDELDLKLFRLQSATKKLVTLLVAANLALPIEIETAKETVASLVEEIESNEYPMKCPVVAAVPDDGSPDIPF